MAAFAHYLPAWVNARGVPMTWRHFQVGMMFIGRHVARQQLREYGTNIIAQADDANVREGWVRQLQIAAEWD